MKPYDTGLICGRFQTFHKGHERLVESGLLLCDRLLILIGSSQECGTERNPFNIVTRTNILKEIYGDRPEIMIYGNDESRSGWFSKADLKNTAELILNRYDMPLSAKKVREYMAKDMRKEWMDSVNPRLHKLYDTLREELMTIDFYQKLAQERI